MQSLKKLKQRLLTKINSDCTAGQHYDVRLMDQIPKRQGLREDELCMNPRCNKRRHHTRPNTSVDWGPWSDWE